MPHIYSVKLNLHFNLTNATIHEWVDTTFVIAGTKTAWACWIGFGCENVTPLL